MGRFSSTRKQAQEHLLYTMGEAKAQEISFLFFVQNGSRSVAFLFLYYFIFDLSKIYADFF